MGRADKESVIGLTGAAQIYVVKEKALRSLSDLPPFSPILTKLVALLAREDVSFRDLAGIIEKDTVLAGNILRLVNSGLYGRRATITSVVHAISLLGHTKLRNVALGLSVGKMWQRLEFARDFSLSRFNHHSIAVALASDQIATRVPVVYPEGAFVAGLFHDIGKLLMAKALQEEYEAIEKFMRSVENRDASVRKQAELEIVGMTTAELSASALERWNLPEEIIEAVQHQQSSFSLAEEPLPLATVLNIADTLAVQIGAGLHPADEDLGEPDLTPLETIGIPSPHEIIDQLQQDFDLMRGAA